MRRLPPLTMPICLLAATLFAIPQFTGCGGGDDEFSSGGSRPIRPFTQMEDKRKKTEMKVTEADYGTTSKGEAVKEFTCQNANGMVMKMITYGATMTSLEVCDRDGNYDNVLLNFPNLEGYENGTSYFGSTVGRYCNRIDAGKFTIDGKEYQLATNDGENHLHGGTVGFDKVVWNAKPIQEDDRVGVEFTYTSPDGEEGYPGKLDVTATYTINNDDILTTAFRATTDKPTHVNLTNHNYWNLNGADSETTILDHVVNLNCPQYLAVDDTLIPTGKLPDVNDTPFDFLSRKSIGKDLEKVTVGDLPIGYDHCFVITPGQRPMGVGTIIDPDSGRRMEVSTDQSGVQFYTGNFLDGSPGSGGYPQYSAFCLETQRYPDSPNKSDVPNWTNTLLQPGRPFSTTTTFKFDQYRKFEEGEVE